MCVLGGTIYRQAAPAWCNCDSFLRFPRGAYLSFMHFPSVHVHGRPCVCPGGAMYIMYRQAAPSWRIFVMPCAVIGAWQRVCAVGGTIYRQAVPSWCILVLHALSSWHIIVLQALPSVHGRPRVCPGIAIYGQAAPSWHVPVCVMR